MLGGHVKIVTSIAGLVMSDCDVGDVSDEDRKYCRRPSTSCETGNESVAEPQDGDDIDDSDLYDTDVETLAG